MQFADIDRPVGLAINYNDPTECLIQFQSAEHITEVLQLVGTTEWIGTHMEIDFRRPRAELVLIIGMLPGDKALEEQQGYEYILIANKKPITHSTSKKGDYFL